ncbi:M1 family metallopeptidase [Paraconexibacter sp. AEG42_29]
MRARSAPSRPAVLAVLCAGGAALAGTAAATAHAAAPSGPGRPLASALSTTAKTVKAGTRVRVAGTVRNAGGRTSKVSLEFKLRSRGRPHVMIPLGRRITPDVRAGGSRRFSFLLTARGSTFPARVTSAYEVVVCVRRAPGDAVARCRKAPTGVTVVPPAVKPAPVPAPAPAPPPALPAPATPSPATPPTTPATPTTPTTPDPAAKYTPGARSLGDTLFPDIGGGGYDVQHYGLDLAYDIASKVLGGTATITLKATQDLSRLTLDFAPWLRVSAVTVDGVAAQFRQADDTPPASPPSPGLPALPGAAADTADYNLDITPPAPGLDRDKVVAVAITYSGVTRPVIDPDGAPDGWIPDTTYGAIAVSEPIGAMGWFPGNNVPFDKATFTTRISVPEVSPPWVAVGTGVLDGPPVVAGGRRTYTWNDPDPTAPYLASVAIAKFDLATDTSRSVPFYTAVDRSFDAAAKAKQLADLNRTPAILDYYAAYFGVPYPFNAMGGINPRQSVGYSLETQGKPTYAVSSAADSAGAGIDTVAHENGHMYFGDHVTLTQWKDIWLNEGMTEFAAWLWSVNQNGGPTLKARFDEVYGALEPNFWSIPPADPPTAGDIFDDNAMYQRGAATMTAIHEILGDARFRTLMRDWLTAPGHPGGNATTEQFIALVKAHDPARAARWDAFFREWLYTSYQGVGPATGRPAITPATF